MVTLLITSVLILGLFAVAVYFWQKPRQTESTEALPPPPDARGLFEEISTPLAIDSPPTPDNDLRESLVMRASSGDRSALKEAHDLNNTTVYDEVLTALTNSCSSNAQILSLTSHVTRNEWPVNKSLASAFLDYWQDNADRSSTAKMLHIAALSDDAETYQRAMESAVQMWRAGKLPDLPATELQALLNGEFWVLSSATRSSGAGFVLKRSLASARRELEQTQSAN